MASRAGETAPTQEVIGHGLESRSMQDFDGTIILPYGPEILCKRKKITAAV
jgi:hypothetical protein